MRMIGLAAVVCVLGAQPATFEVASVRPVESGRGGGGMRRPGIGLRPGSRGQSIQTGPDTLTMRNVTFQTCVRWAYGVQDFQVTGPDWIGDARFDLVAKAPGQATEDELRAMLRSLLAERFHLETHRQTKELPAWVLTVAKGGPKFHESAESGEGAIEPDLAHMRVGVRHMSVGELATYLSQLLRAPVFDETGLHGRYDITIAIDKYIPDPSTPVDMLSTVLNGIQQELGLKVDTRKVSMDLIVVDRADRVPVEN